MTEECSRGVRAVQEAILMPGGYQRQIDNLISNPESTTPSVFRSNALIDAYVSFIKIAWFNVADPDLMRNFTQRARLIPVPFDYFVDQGIATSPQTIAGADARAARKGSPSENTLDVEAVTIENIGRFSPAEQELISRLRRPVISIEEYFIVTDPKYLRVEAGRLGRYVLCAPTLIRDESTGLFCQIKPPDLYFLGELQEEPHVHAYVENLAQPWVRLDEPVSPEIRFPEPRRVGGPLPATNKQIATLLVYLQYAKQAKSTILP